MKRWIFVVLAIITGLQAAAAERYHAAVFGVSPFGVATLVDGQEIALAGITVPAPVTQDAAFGNRDGQQLPGSDDLTNEERAQHWFATRDQPKIAWTPLIRDGEMVRDRHRRALAIVWVEDGQGLQASLLRRGLVALDRQTAPDDMIDEWRQAEREAREARIGIWSDVVGDGLHADAATVTARPFRYAIVRGVVTDVGRGGGFSYLNFGDNWRDDFTVRIPEKLAKVMGREGLEVEALTGKTLEVRGWIFRANGPMIELVSSKQIELLP